MDIQVSSNFERLYFELAGRDGKAVTSAFSEFRETGKLPIAKPQWDKARGLFAAYRVDEDQTRAAMKAVYQESGRLIDPHSAVALAAANGRAAISRGRWWWFRPRIRPNSPTRSKAPPASGPKRRRAWPRS